MDPWTRSSVLREKSLIKEKSAKGSRKETITSLSDDLLPENFGETNRSRLPSELEANEKQHWMSKKKEKLIKFEDDAYEVAEVEGSENTNSLLRNFGKDIKTVNDSDSSTTAGIVWYYSIIICIYKSTFH